MYNEKVKNVKYIFNKLLKKAGVQKKEISLIITRDVAKFAIYRTIIHYFSSSKFNEIVLGPRFFKISEEQQKGIIAHELGHHEHHKKHSIKLFKKHQRWHKMYKGKLELPFPHWKKRLDDRLKITEMCADNYAVKLGYGKQLLNYYKTYTPHQTHLIKNLEQKLETIS